MSFPELDDLFAVGEGLMKHIWKKVLNIDIKTPFKRIPFHKSLELYGTDKPDLRFGLTLSDISDIAESSDFNVFKDLVKKGGIVKAVCPDAQFSRKETDGFEKLVKQNNAKGLAAIKVTDKGLEGGPAKFFNKELQKKLLKRTGAKAGSTIFMVGDNEAITNDCLARLRNELGQ
jgi:aspartyl-tRNA synthetase